MCDLSEYLVLSALFSILKCTLFCCCMENSELRRHQRIYNGEKYYNCEDDDQFIIKISDIKSHQVIQGRESPFKCEECVMYFSDVIHLRLHDTIHTGEIPCKFEKCEKSFSNPTDQR